MMTNSEIIEKLSLSSMKNRFNYRDSQRPKSRESVPRQMVCGEIDKGIDPWKMALVRLKRSRVKLEKVVSPTTKTNH